jgi:hypothetical protein
MEVIDDCFVLFGDILSFLWQHWSNVQKKKRWTLGKQKVLKFYLSFFSTTVLELSWVELSTMIPLYSTQPPVVLNSTQSNQVGSWKENRHCCFHLSSSSYCHISKDTWSRSQLSKMCHGVCLNKHINMTPDSGGSTVVTVDEESLRTCLCRRQTLESSGMYQSLRCGRSTRPPRPPACFFLRGTPLNMFKEVLLRFY